MLASLLRRPWLLGVALVAVVALLVGGAVAVFGGGGAPAPAAAAGVAAPTSAAPEIRRLRRGKSWARGTWPSGISEIAPP